MSPVSSALLAEIRRRPSRLLLTGLAIVVATVFAAGTVLLSETLRGYLTEISQETPAGAAVVVVPGSDAETKLDALAAAVSGVDGVAEVVQVWEAFPTASSGRSIWQMRSDPMAGPLSRLSGTPVQGRLPTGDGEAAVGAATAERTGLGPGSTVTLAARGVVADGEAAGTGLQVITITGIVELPAEGIDTLIARPELVAALDGALDQIEIAAVPGVDPGELADRVARAVGADVMVRTGAEQRELEVEQASTTVTAVLIGVGVFAGLAVIAAAVVVASTFRIVLTQRRTQLALLRCLGARRRQLVAAVLIEAALSGLVAGLLGIAIALLAGYGVVTAIRFNGGTDVPTFVIPWPALAGCLCVAVLTTMLAALVPARSASRIPPVAALRAASLTDAGQPRRGRRLVVAALFVIAAAGMVVGSRQLADELGLLLVVASGLTTFAALVVAGPVLVRGLGATVGRLVAVIGRAPGRLGIANAVHVPRRTAATISVLALGVGLTSALLVGIATAQAGAEAAIARQFPSEVVVETTDTAHADALARRLSADPGVTARVDGTVVFADPADGVNARELRRVVEDAVADQPPVLVRYAGDMRQQFESSMEGARLFGLGLVGMTVLVAVVGVGVTLALSVTERDRETGLLRALGLSRRGVRGMVACEAALCGAGAALVGTVIGAAYGGLGAHVLGLATAGVHVPASTLGVLVAVVVAVAVCAATLPAIRAGRVPPLRALQR